MEVLWESIVWKEICWLLVEQAKADILISELANLWFRLQVTYLSEEDPLRSWSIWIHPLPLILTQTDCDLHEKKTCLSLEIEGKKQEKFNIQYAEWVRVIDMDTIKMISKATLCSHRTGRIFDHLNLNLTGHFAHTGLFNIFALSTWTNFQTVANLSSAMWTKPTGNRKSAKK